LFRGRLDFPIAMLTAFVINVDNLWIRLSMYIWFVDGVYLLGNSNWFSVIYWLMRLENRSQFSDLSFHLFIGSVLEGWRKIWRKIAIVLANGRFRCRLGRCSILYLGQCLCLL
jgi:hypothetical protein